MTLETFAQASKVDCHAFVNFNLRINEQDCQFLQILLIRDGICHGLICGGTWNWSLNVKLFKLGELF